MNFKPLKSNDMRKISISFFLAFFFLMNLISAQETQKTFVLGLSFSPSIDWLSPSTPNYSSDGVLVRYAYGIDMDFSLAHSPNYFIHTGLQLKLTGGRLNFTDKIIVNNDSTVKDVSRKYKINYIRLPLAFKLKTNQFGRFTFYGLFGLDFDIRAGATADDEYRKLNPVSSVNKIDINDDVSLLRAGLLVGAGAEYTISGNTKAFAGIHYSNGFTDTFTGSNLNTGAKENATAKYVELTIGILF
jgi:opacity protein-like surface antigen